MRGTAILGAVTVLGFVSGCGNSTAPSTSTAVQGVAVAPDRYLADTAAAAQSVTAFAAVLRTVPAPATPELLKAVVPQLDPPLAKARLAAQRLTAERLADRRLDEQRIQRATGFSVALGAMQRVRDAAAAGDAATARTASDELNQALSTLRGPAP